MSESRRPEDETTQGASPSWDQPSSTASDRPQPGQSSSEPTGVTADEPAWTPAPPASSETGGSQTPAYEPVPAETTYQPAYTPPAAAAPAYPPAYQPPEQAAYPPQYQQPQAVYQQQQPYPPQYQQPASAWGQSSVVAETRDHAHSLAVALASVFLGFWGLIFTLFGILFLIGGASIGNLIRSDPQFDSVDPAQIDQAIGALGGGAIFMLLIGLPHLLAAIGAPLHKGWARWTGVIVSVLGVLLGVLIMSAGRTTTVVNDQRVTVDAIGPAMFFIVPYALTLLALILSRRHFRSS